MTKIEAKAMLMAAVSPSELASYLNDAMLSDFAQDFEFIFGDYTAESVLDFIAEKLANRKAEKEV